MALAAPVLDQLDRLTPLQRSVLQILLDGRPRTARETSSRIESLTPPMLGMDFSEALHLAVCRSLEHLVEHGLIEHRGMTRYVLAPAPLSDLRPLRPLDAC